MWTTIAKAISLETGEEFELIDKHEVAGGDINLSFIVSGKKPRTKPQSTEQNTAQYFVKINEKSHYPLLETERENLLKIKQLSSLHCPTPICLATTLDKSFLVLSFEDLTPPENEHCYYDLGVALAQMHLSTKHGQFGWHRDNYIGKTLQPNQWQTNWRTFFAEQRIGWQLQLLAEKSIVLGEIELIIALCHDILSHHKVSPCLVHGDLWQGNIGFVNGKPLIYDPACYFADREVDIAMSELFGAFPKEFYQGYEITYPLTGDYEQRKIVYNFYHVLNHLNMFGNRYLAQAKNQLTTLFRINEMSK